MENNDRRFQWRNQQLKDLRKGLKVWCYFDWQCEILDKEIEKDATLKGKVTKSKHRDPANPDLGSWWLYRKKD